METDSITRLVVGESMTLAMGVPVGQHLNSTDVSSTLRWQGGQWTAPYGILDKVKKALQKQPSVLKIPVGAAPAGAAPKQAARNLKIAIASCGAIILTALAIFLSPAGQNLGQRRGPPAADDLAVVPNAAGAKDGKVEAVRSVNEPWIRPAQEQTQSTDAGAIIPVVPGSLTSPNSPSGDSRVAAPPPLSTPEPVKAAPPSAQRPATDTKPPEKKSAEAVILDVEAASPAAKTQATAAVAVTPGKPAAKEAPKRVGAGLVALTPDGKSALFTNPTTRLPEKFGIGDKLPSGETLRLIDPNSGTVKTDAREYRLE